MSCGREAQVHTARPRRATASRHHRQTAGPHLGCDLTAEQRAVHVERDRDRDCAAAATRRRRATPGRARASRPGRAAARRRGTTRVRRRPHGRGACLVVVEHVVELKLEAVAVFSSLSLCLSCVWFIVWSQLLVAHGPMKYDPRNEDRSTGACLIGEPGTDWAHSSMI